jgi:hypothetical protein
MPPPYPELTQPQSPAQIEAAMQDLATNFPTLCTLIKLPETTWENREVHCIKIANGTGGGRPRVLFAGGVHARESAPPDALIRLAQKMLVSYKDGVDMVYPARVVTPVNRAPIHYDEYRISKDLIKRIINAVDLFIAPCINPDGRQFDQRHLPPPDQLTGEGWRKNRRPDADPLRIGVDINRNFDIAWDFNNYYDMTTFRLSNSNPNDPASADPKEETFRGPGPLPETEPETRNLRSLINDNKIRYYVDVHMFGRKVLFPWGIEEDGDDSTKHFRNGAFDRQRDGLIDGDPHINPAVRPNYKEFLPNTPPHFLRKNVRAIAQAMCDAILRSAHIDPAAPGTSPAAVQSTYQPKQSFLDGLHPLENSATTGSSDDYATSRQFVDPSRAPVFAFTFETGDQLDRGFHPDYGNPPGSYHKIERETHAGLVGLLSFLAAPASSPTGCLIATATMGTPDHPDVAFLRELRDVRLRATPAGARAAAALDRVYYSFSPAVAAYLSRHDRARTAVRALAIRPLVATLRRLAGPPPRRTSRTGAPDA